MTYISTLVELLKQAIENRLLDVHTALIAKVESYDAEKQQVNVAPVLKWRIKDSHEQWMSEQLSMLCDALVRVGTSSPFPYSQAILSSWSLTNRALMSG